MTRLDRILAPLAVLCLALYLGVLVWRVPLPALIIVCGGGVLLAAFDFARSAAWQRRMDRNNQSTNGK